MFKLSWNIFFSSFFYWWMVIQPSYLHTSADCIGACWYIIDLPTDDNINFPIYCISCIPNYYVGLSPLTLNFHMPPMSSLLSKQTGSRPSSTQTLIQTRPELPAPTTATRRTIAEHMWGGTQTIRNGVMSKNSLKTVYSHASGSVRLYLGYSSALS